MRKRPEANSTSSGNTSPLLPQSIFLILVSHIPHTVDTKVIDGKTPHFGKRSWHQQVIKSNLEFQSCSCYIYDASFYIRMHL